MNYQAAVGRFKWRAADGEIVSMYDMDERYLRNCLALCERHENTGKANDFREVLATHDAEWEVFA